MDTGRHLENLPDEQWVDFGRPGWYFIACILIGNLITQHTKYPLLFTAGALISVSAIYFLILWVAKLFYKNRKEQKGFLLVKKISFSITIALCLALLFTFVIVTIGAKNEAIKKDNKGIFTTTSTFIITPIQFEGDNDIFYPSMAGLNNKAVQDSFNIGVKKMVDDEIESFNKLADEFENKENGNAKDSSLELNYQIIGQNSNYISIKFNGYLYSGGAHGSNINISYNFDLINGQKIELADLFKPDSNYLKVLSDYAINELKDRNLGDSRQVEDGASPKAENFKMVNISDNGLLFTFGDYQVAPYSVGPQTVFIPYEYLKNILK